MRVQAAHVYEPGSCPSKDQQRAENHDKCTTAHPEPQDHEDQGKTMLQSWQSFGCVVGVCPGTRESEMSLGGDDGTKHDINPSMEIVHSIQPELHHQRCEYLDGPSEEIIASFACCDTNVGKVRPSLSPL